MVGANNSKRYWRFFVWFILKCVPVSYTKVSARYAKRSLKSKKKILTCQISKYNALTSEGANRSTYLSAPIYAAHREQLKGLIWLPLGLITVSVIPVFGPVGFIGTLYCFIKAASVTAPIDTDIDKTQKLQELRNELEEVKTSLNRCYQ
ncbi:MAG: hypothetical protein VYC49_15125 [Pseudomonadota bacterium]|jgi:hypothetical protein|uniref:hypothetical protein n=1 Tax=Alloalcanivorax venustensis TaxID=172371 RepID=UPI002E989900|nr:hypothetical protein [Pseudomonadota bacterium]|tara:strand:- start:2019 stop:2465 length:447 start_codon:yes stop_codon:yes gene_type:complete